MGRKIGLSDLIEYNGGTSSNMTFKSIYGDALEALVGACYLDRGYSKSKTFILQKLILPHIDLDHIVSTTTNFKSKIIEWSQKENRTLVFEVEEVESKNHFKRFEAVILVDDQEVSRGHGLSKKKAEQCAAEKSCEVLNLS